MMKKIISVIVGYCASFAYFLFVNSYVAETEISTSGLVSHMIGGNKPWITVYSFNKREDVFQLLFGGNEGILINWYAGLHLFIKVVSLGVIIGVGVWFLLTFFTERWLKKKRNNESKKA